MRRLARLFVLIGCTALPLHASAGPSDTAPPPAAPAPPEMLKFGFDDLMTLLVQPRHEKLYYAGTQKNWELAAAEARNLRGALARIADSIPSYTNLGVRDATASLFAPAMASLDAAIAAADPRRFASAYKDVTAACNACHVYMEHPYILIKVPDATTPSSYADQDFRGVP